MVTMFGLSFDGSGELVETQVHPDNVNAFKMAGWQEGELPKEDVKITFDDSEIEVIEKSLEVKKRPRGRR